MKLSDLKIGQTAIIESIGGEGALRQHFLDMGVIPGAEVTLNKYAPMGDPMQLTIQGYALTLRKDDAKKIEAYLHPLPEGKGATNSLEKDSCESNPPSLQGRVEESLHPGLGEGGRYHDSKNEHPLPEGTVLRFALAGNQNSGKTTLFNQLTGANQHVGNFPGVTVDRKSGSIRGRSNTEVTDLPGIYSLSPYSAEEIVSRDFILGKGNPDGAPLGIINIVDSTNIERNLYLTMQLKIGRAHV